MAEVRSLAVLRDATRMLAECRTIEDAKKLADVAEAARVYAEKAHLGEEAIQYAWEVKIDALTLVGRMVIEGQEKGTVRRPGQKPNSTEAVELQVLGLTWKESSEAQFLWMLLLENPKAHEAVKQEVGSMAKARRACRRERQVSKEQQAKRETRATWTITDKQDVIPCSVLITDPPYGILDEVWEPKQLYEFTRDWLERWSTCGADFVLSFWSQRYLWEGKDWFDEHLRGYEFQQLLVWHYRNNKSPQSRRGFKQTWEPILFYRRRDSQKEIEVGGAEWGDDLHDFDCHVAAVPQSNFTGADMKQHPAQKPVSVFRWLVNATTQPGELVCDPFAGSGTCGIAALQLGRGFHGIETDTGFRRMAKGRISEYGKIHV